MQIKAVLLNIVGKKQMNHSFQKKLLMSSIFPNGNGLLEQEQIGIKLKKLFNHNEPN